MGILSSIFSDKTLTFTGPPFGSLYFTQESRTEKKAHPPGRYALQQGGAVQASCLYELNLQAIQREHVSSLSISRKSCVD